MLRTFCGQLSGESQKYGETNDNQGHQRSISFSPQFQYPDRLVSFLRKGERDAHPGAGLRILQRRIGVLYGASFMEWLELTDVHRSRAADGSWLIRLSFLIKRDGIGSPADLLPFGLALDLVSNLPDAAFLLSFVNTAHPGRSLLAAIGSPPTGGLSKPTPAAFWGFRKSVSY